jgi:hypothetical protein
LAVALVGCFAVDRDRRTAMPVGDVRTRPIGSHVLIEGVVTVPSGTFDAGFALEDASGGIYVSGPTETAVELGAMVRVRGTLAAPDNRVTVEPTAIEIEGRGRPPAPRKARTGAVGPVTEGRLVVVCGTVVGGIVDDRPWGFKLSVSDGSGPLLVFIATATRIDVTPYRAGQALRVVGLSGRFGQHTELLPRRPSDIAVVSDVGCDRLN